MKAINWSNYTPADFQRFCNSFLSFEFGKPFQPFNAAGRDGGIDGKFSGEYSGAKGEWRFQYKYHSTARKTAVNTLHTEIKTEATKLGTETFFILLTNIELLPQEEQKLVLAFQENKPKNSNTDCEIWDGAKIHSLSLQYPLLWLWLDDGFITAQVIEYKTVFQKLLSGSIDDAFTFTNKFGYREDKIAELFEFVQSDKKVCLITGEAGIGKTRLVVEFFKQLDFVGDDAICLVLMTKQIDFDKLSYAFTGSQKILLLVDDAHEYDPKTISDLNNLVATAVVSVKLILTAREIQSSNSIRLIKEYERLNIQRIKLDVLSREDTHKLLEQELYNSFYLNYINELTAITYGKPILIVAILKAAHKNLRIEQVKADGFLSDYVVNYFNLFIEELIKDTGISKLKANKLLQLVCIVEPFSYADKEFVRKMAAFIQADEDAVVYALKLLSDHSFVSGRYEQIVKPDYYSDIIVKQAERGFTEEVVNYFAEKISNIIANLASADDTKSNSNSLLDEILYKYIEPVAYLNASTIVSGILSTIDNVSYFKTDIAQKTVELYIQGFKNIDSSVYKDFEGRKQYNLFGGSSDLDKIKSILSNLLYHEKCFGFVYTKVFELFDCWRDAKLLLPVFQFSKKDAIEYFTSIRQFYFIERLKTEFAEYGRERQLFAIEYLKAFLTHDFTAAAATGQGMESITITTYYIPASTDIKALRKEIIDLMIGIYKRAIDESFQTILLETLLDIPRGILATTRNPTPYDGDDEIGYVFTFLRDEAALVPQSAQKEVFEKLFWFKQWKINESFLPIMEEIKERMSPRNFTEQLIQLFAQAENRLNFDKAEKDLKESLHQIYNTTDASVIAEGLSSVYNAYGNKLYNFHLGITELAFHFNKLSMEVYLELWQLNRSLVYQYGYVILNALYFEFHENTFFWEQINLLEKEDSVEADNMLLWVYGTRQAKMMVVSNKDLDVIEKIAKKKHLQNNFNLARPLVVCVVHNPELGLELGIEFLSRCNNQEADHFFLFLYDNADACYDVLKILVLEGTLRFELAYNMERCLNEVFKREGGNIFFDYVMRRVENKREMLKADTRYFNYELLPDGKYSHLLDGIDETVRSKLFARIVDWYCNSELSFVEIMFLDGLFEFFNRVNYLTEETATALREVLNRNKDNVNALIRLLEILKVYHDKNNVLISLVNDIYITAFKAGTEHERQKKDINFKAYQALTTLGVKSGTAGQPFQVDIDLKDLLETYLPSVPSDSPFYGIMQSAIHLTKRNIEDSYDRGNETW